MVGPIDLHNRFAHVATAGELHHGGRIAWRWICASAPSLLTFLTKAEEAATQAGFRVGSAAGGAITSVRRYDNGSYWLIVPLSSDVHAWRLFAELRRLWVTGLGLFTYRAQHDPHPPNEVVRSYIVPHAALGLRDQRPFDPMACDLQAEGPASLYEAAETQMLTWAPFRMGLGGVPTIGTVIEREWLPPTPKVLSTADAKRLISISQTNLASNTQTRISPISLDKFRIVLDSSHSRTTSHLSRTELEFLETSVSLRRHEGRATEGDLRFLHALEQMLASADLAQSTNSNSPPEPEPEQQHHAPAPAPDGGGENETDAPNVDDDDTSVEGRCLEFMIGDELLVLTEQEVARVKERWSLVAILRPLEPTEAQQYRLAQVLAEAPDDPLWERCMELFRHLARTDQMPPHRLSSTDPVGALLTRVAYASPDKRTQTIVARSSANDLDVLLDAMNRLL